MAASWSNNLVLMSWREGFECVEPESLKVVTPTGTNRSKYVRTRTAGRVNCGRLRGAERGLVTEEAPPYSGVCGESRQTRMLTDHDYKAFNLPPPLPSLSLHTS